VDRLDLFSLFGELFPRLATVLVIAALIFAPKLVADVLVSAGREEAGRITRALESAIPGAHRHHSIRKSPRALPGPAGSQR
jgi:hypothetical protein